MFLCSRAILSYKVTKYFLQRTADSSQVCLNWEGVRSHLSSVIRLVCQQATRMSLILQYKGYLCMNPKSHLLLALWFKQHPVRSSALDKCCHPTFLSFSPKNCFVDCLPNRH